MKNTMTQREQQYYYSVFHSARMIDLNCNNAIKLFQFSDVHCKTSNDTLDKHDQNCHEITFVYGGEGVIIQNGQEQSIKSGQVHLCFEGDTHQIIPSKSSPFRFYCMGFTIEPSNPLSAMLDEVRQKVSPENSVLSDCTDLLGAFRSVLSSLYSENQNEITNAIAANALNYILSTVFCGFLRTNHEAHDNVSIKDSLLFYVVNYLKNNVYQINALSQLSNETGYSYSYLSHLFSQKMGQSLKSFFASIRMDAADQLLLEKSVTEVSDLLGYSSVHAFSRAYKSIRHTLPNTVHQKAHKTP